ncbi:MAG: hypothetical protein ACKERG_04285 [Candidatus Hodgkinia cicadicola]
MPLEEMVHVAKVLRYSAAAPLLMARATNEACAAGHTAVKLCPRYLNGVIVHVSDAGKAVEVMAKLTSESNAKHINDIEAETQSSCVKTRFLFLRAPSRTPRNLNESW